MISHRAIVLRYGFQTSMSHKGNPYENTITESFLKMLKVEEVYL